MFEEILIQSLSEFDDDTLNYILESCTEDELSYLDMAIEAVSDADRDQLRSGYKLDTRNGIGGFVNSFKNSGADKWKNLGHDLKTHATRIKNNLKGDGDQVSTHFGDSAADRENKRIDSRIGNYRKRVDDIDADRDHENTQTRYDTLTKKRDRIEGKMTKLNNLRDALTNKARQNDVNAKANNNSLSYKIGNGLKTLRNTVKSKIDTWKANRQQNQS